MVSQEPEQRGKINVHERFFIPVDGCIQLTLNYKYRDFLKGYTYLIPSGDVRCLTPEGPLGLQVLNTSHLLKVLNSIFLLKKS